ncbi:MAG: valine--tRNA ligase [Dehalococcoidia bacterium]
MTTELPQPAEMATAYEPGAVEESLYEWWEASGYFQPSGSGKPFTIIMPPPNVTGELHVGHALTVAVEDLLIRWHRMLGDDTLWLPGVDHAAIAVQNVVERELRREGLERRELGREEFLRRVWEWVHKTRSAISRQHRRLGASADWSRERFTMDDVPQQAVRQTFVRLYNEGLIYRGVRLVNWCVDCGTAISDLEVEHDDEPGSFWYVRYPVVGDDEQPTGEHIVIATTRPETIPADSAVAVHPEDPRYAALIGKRVQVPTGDRVIPIIADAAVSIEGGSGALKVTPGHDPVDFEIGQRHDLPIHTVIGFDGKMTADSGAYEGLDRFAARTRVVADIEARGLLERVEPYTHAIGHCQRSGTIVEPLLSEQWFVRVRPEAGRSDQHDLAGDAIEAVRSGRIQFVPPRFERTYMHWMENIRDWTISRQIWWGHRIPVWYCEACGAMTVPSLDDVMGDPGACGACGSTLVRQDEDTLDTWFSSGLWPHSTLGWPNAGSADLKYYPTQVMETGYDIIFFWVARMIMLSLYNMDGVAPFETVYLHGLVRAPDGQKMSKSKGNTVDPLQSIATYGTDALRYALISSTSPGNDQRITDQRLEAGRNLANKLWNASRFVISMVEAGDDLTVPAAGSALALEDRWILSRAERVFASVGELLEKFELGEAVRQLRDFFWEEFADWYIEAAKVRVREGDRSPMPVLVHVLDRTLRALHPAMPYVTEAIWQRLNALRPDPEGASALIIASYPQAEAARLDDGAEREFAALQDFVRGIRNVRAEKRVEAGRWVESYIVAGEVAPAARAWAGAIEQLARTRPLHIVDGADEAPSDGVVTAVLPVGRVVLPLGGMVDADAERARLGKQIAEVEGVVTGLEAKLGDANFASRAPAAIVAKEQERLDTARGRLAGLRESLAELG